MNDKQGLHMRKFYHMYATETFNRCYTGNNKKGTVLRANTDFLYTHIQYMHNCSPKTLHILPGSRLHNPVHIHKHIPAGPDVVSSASAPPLPLHMQVALRSQDLPVPLLELKYHSPSPSLISAKQPKGRPPECSCLNLPAFRTFPDLDKSLHSSLLIGDKPMPSQVLLVVVT